MSSTIQQTIPQTISPRPFLKWAGGKTQLISQYQPYFPKYFNNYYEPFLGGGAIFFHLRQQFPSLTARLTDINSELINTYCCVRDRVEELIALLQVHQQKHSHNYYYRMRKDIPDTRTKKAARIIYLNRTCFNGLYRENSQGQFNVPMGRYTNPKICNQDLLRSVSLALKKTELEVKPFNWITETAKAGDFVYFDPPYYPLSPTSNFTSYSRNSFTEDDQKKLSELFTELAKRQVKVMLSNSDCKFIRRLYSQFYIHEISATRYINSKGTRRGTISEILVTSYCN